MLGEMTEETRPMQILDDNNDKMDDADVDGQGLFW